jgi:hypothetical protein
MSERFLTPLISFDFLSPYLFTLSTYHFTMLL